MSVEIAWFPAERCYREVEHVVHVERVGGLDLAVTVAKLGQRMSWVDDAPDDHSDGSGHFEVDDR